MGSRLFTALKTGAKLTDIFARLLGYPVLMLMVTSQIQDTFFNDDPKRMSVDELIDTQKFDPKLKEILGEAIRKGVVVIDPKSDVGRLLKRYPYWKDSLPPNGFGDFASGSLPNCQIFTLSLKSHDELIKRTKRSIPLLPDDFKLSNIDWQEIALWTALHEIGHCKQPDKKRELGWQGNPHNEADADAFAIETIEKINPKSNIRRVLLAIRALSPSASHSYLALLDRLGHGDTQSIMEIGISTMAFKRHMEARSKHFSHVMMVKHPKKAESLNIDYVASDDGQKKMHTIYGIIAADIELASQDKFAPDFDHNLRRFARGRIDGWKLLAPELYQKGFEVYKAVTGKKTNPELHPDFN